MSMTAPLKPWELSMAGTIPSPGIPYVPNTNTGRLHSSAIINSGGGGGNLVSSQLPSTSSGGPPPLPPRQDQTRPIYSAYNRSSAYSSSSPYSSYGGYSPYTSGGGFYNNPYSFSGGGGYGSYGMGMGYGGRPGMGYGGGPGGYGEPGPPSFSQIAEESASPAFQSIESFVGAFCSISAMLESTFHALYSSFRAVIGVADHLGRVKQILSALTIFRFFKWVYRRFLYLVGISKIKPADVESLWKNLTSGSEGDVTDLLQAGGENRPSSWPILMFLGFIFAGPYLMWKLIKSFNLDPARQDKRKWATGESEHFVAVAEYPFDPMSDRELDLKPGQMIRLAPSKFQPPNVKGWVLASDGAKIGLVPTNYIKIKGKRLKGTTLLGAAGGGVPLVVDSGSLPLSQTNSTNSSPEKHVSFAPTSSSATSSVEAVLTAEEPEIRSASADTSDDDTDTLVGDFTDD